jgi:hypothetical protein
MDLFEPFEPIRFESFDPFEPFKPIQFESFDPFEPFKPIQFESFDPFEPFKPIRFESFKPFKPIQFESFDAFEPFEPIRFESFDPFKPFNNNKGNNLCHMHEHCTHEERAILAQSSLCPSLHIHLCAHPCTVILAQLSFAVTLVLYCESKMHPFPFLHSSFLHTFLVQLLIHPYFHTTICPTCIHCSYLLLG